MKLKNFAMITEDKVTEIFCIADDFCKLYDAQMAKTCGENVRHLLIKITLATPYVAYALQ